MEVSARGCRGLISNIQRYSIHDGPGIRTLIFLMGCPLGCLWCANPEGQFFSPKLLYSSMKCINCWECIQLCSVQAISKRGSVIEIDRDRCDNCGRCTDRCFSEALQLVGAYSTTEEVLMIVEKDRKFYETSGGGVTFSGGEPLMQIEFLRETLKACKERGLSTAIETCGHTSWENYESILDYTDTFFYDIKHMNPDEHLKLTGASNELILENLKKLSERHHHIIVRIPIIPGCNDQEENLYSTAKFLDMLNNIEQIELLPYHRFGKSKYDQLGVEYKLNHLKPLSEEKLRKAERLLHDTVDKKILRIST